MKKLIVANWKSNPGSAKEAASIGKNIDREAGKLGNISVAIAPPAVFLETLKPVLAKTILGAQNVFWEDLGAWTGEISWRHLKNEKISLVLVGHSERRRLVGETDEMVNKKVISALKAGFITVLCVGEPAEIRSGGIDAAKKYVGDQLSAALKGVKPSGKLAVAYEPVWAIGTGIPDKPDETSEMSVFIKATVSGEIGVKNVPVLYGGSVTDKNAKSFLSRKEIDGALVGGASLKAGFKAILRIAAASSHV